MATKKLDSRIQNKYDTEQNWNTNNPVLLNGELIIVSKEDGTVGFKVGDGTKKYSELSWAVESVDLSNLQKEISGEDGQVIVKTTSTPGEVKAIDAPWLPTAGGTYDNIQSPFLLAQKGAGNAYQFMVGGSSDTSRTQAVLGVQNSAGLGQVLLNAETANRAVYSTLSAQVSGHETFIRTIAGLEDGTGRILITDPIVNADNGEIVSSNDGTTGIRVDNEGIYLTTSGIAMGFTDSLFGVVDSSTNAYSIEGSANGLKITGLQEPKKYNEPATKAYVDDLVGSNGGNFSKKQAGSFNNTPTSASGNPSGYQYYIDETVSGMTSSINPLVFPNWSTLSDVTTYQDNWNRITAIESKDNILRFYFADSASVNIKYIVYY